MTAQNDTFPVHTESDLSGCCTVATVHRLPLGTYSVLLYCTRKYSILAKGSQFTMHEIDVCFILPVSTCTVKCTKHQPAKAKTKIK